MTEEKTEDKPKRQTRATPATKTDKRTVVQRILDIAAEVGVLEPEAKGGVPFQFRGVDATVAHLTPMLNKHGVFVAPTNVSHLVRDREVGNRVVKTTEVEVTWRFYGAEGDYIDVTTPGLADDFADRSTAQAMSVSYRIALLQTFHIAAFGKEPEQTGQDVMDGRVSAEQAKVNNAKGQATTASPAAAAATQQMVQAILAAAKAKGMGTEELNNFGQQIAGEGVSPDVWFNDPNVLNQILVKIQG